MGLCDESLLPTGAGLINWSFTLPDFDFMGLFPIGGSDPWFPFIDFPEMEGEFRMKMLIQQFHSWVMQNVLSIINETGVFFVELTVNILGVAVDIVKFFTDVEYVNSLKKMFSDAIDFFYNLIPDPFKFWGGEGGVSWPDFQLQNIWSYFMRMMNEGLLSPLIDAIKALIKYVEDLLQTGGPAFPDISIPDISGIIQSIMDGAGTIWDKIKALKDLEFWGFNFDAIMGGDVSGDFEIPERILQRVVEALHNFVIEYPKKLLFEFIDAIKSFLSNVPGIGEIFDMVVMTFCSFLKSIVGFDPDAIAASLTSDPSSIA